MRCQLKVALVILTALICPAVAFATVSVSISPSTVQVQPGGQAQFNAVVSGTNSVVVWSLTGVNCSGVACGQISSTGLYLAPTTAPSPNVVTVTATVLSDLSVTASAAAIVGSSSDVKVTVSPTAATVLVGQQQQFVSFVSGTTITGVNWQSLWRILRRIRVWHDFCGWRLYCARHPADSGAGYGHSNFDCRSVEVGLQRSDGGVAGGYQHLSDIRHVEYWDAEAVHDDGSKYHEHRCDLERFRQRLQRGKLRNDHEYRSLYRTIISAKSSPGLCGGNVGGRSDQDKHSDGYDHSASSGFDCAYDRPGTHRRPSAVYGNSHEYDEHDRKLERRRQRVQWIQLRNCHLRRALYCSRYCSLPRSGLCDGDLGCGSHQIQHCFGDNKPARRQ